MANASNQDRREKIILWTCVASQIGSLIALILQGIRVGTVYEERKYAGDTGIDASGTDTKTHFAVFVVIIVLGVLKQPLIWYGLFCQNFCFTRLIICWDAAALCLVAILLGLSVFIDSINTIFCATIIMMFGGKSVISTIPGIIFGFMSMITTGLILYGACNKEMVPTEEPEEDQAKDLHKTEVKMTQA
jgi:hypothetical protein